MEEILNRDIQRRVIETKHVYFRPTAIIRCPEKCDKQPKTKLQRYSHVSNDFRLRGNKGMWTCTKADIFLEILQREGLGGYLQFKKYVADFSPFDHEKQMLTLFMKTLDKLNHRLCFQNKANLSELIAATFNPLFNFVLRLYKKTC